MKRKIILLNVVREAIFNLSATLPVTLTKKRRAQTTTTMDIKQAIEFLFEVEGRIKRGEKL